MDCRQLLRQLRHIGAQMTWPAAGQPKVFARVTVSAREPDPDQPPAALPALVIQWHDARPAGECATWRRQGVRLHVLAANACDDHGEAALLDGAPTLGDSSAGTGLARLCTAVRSAFGTLTPADGISGGLARLTDQPAVTRGKRRPDVVRATFELEARHHDAVSFPALAAFSATPGVEQVSLSWTFGHAAARFDHAGIHIRRDTGSAPATPDDGTLVYAGNGDSPPHLDTGLTPGTEYFYSAWATFDADLPAEGAGADSPVADTFSDSALSDSATPTA